MLKALVAGVVVGGFLTVVFARTGKRRHQTQTSMDHRRTEMTAEEKVIARAQALLAERPETATPDQNFLRDWAYGNAGLEDESITVEQVERVLAGRTA
jgi:hypothetical protein